MKIDINCDMGESFGSYTIGEDEKIIEYVTSANIACGFHAGDPMIMDKTVRLAKEHGVAVGAHPGYPDLCGYGRRNLETFPGEVKNYLFIPDRGTGGLCKGFRADLAACQTPWGPL